MAVILLPHQGCVLTQSPSGNYCSEFITVLGRGEVSHHPITIWNYMAASLLSHLGVCIKNRFANLKLGMGFFASSQLIARCASTQS
ncbi:hypothetical protein RRG08_064250 [Elysia crispata]|uniref:Uncharacterized protein n=1 Tax=Elysia crispata TaxID=231223 RepID=A0AAE1EBT3_9GAST|nr:hypothetical protein RRG08_064250 [Elysia crispata]